MLLNLSYHHVCKNIFSLTALFMIFCVQSQADATIQELTHDAYGLDTQNYCLSQDIMPKIDLVEDYIVITNFDWSSMTEDELNAFRQSIVEIEACTSLDDIYFFLPKSCLILAGPSFLSDLRSSNNDSYFPPEEPFNIQLCSNGAKERVSKSELEKAVIQRNNEIHDCKINCEAAARAGELACTRLPLFTAQIGCVVVLELTLARCKSCCEAGMGNCFDKFMEAMQPHIKNFFDTREL